jgi:hypothetical protein
MRRSTIVLVLMLASACNRSPTGPSVPGVTPGPNSGTWTGTLRDDANGQGDLRVALQDTLLNGNSVLSGTWATTYADASKNAAGEASGGVTGTTVFLTLRRTPPLTCASAGLTPALNGGLVSLALTLSGRTIAGSYTYQACAGAIPGTLTLTKQ